MAESGRLCAICGTRKPKRFCPGVNGDICTICCGTQREVTVDCPLTCRYLIEAHSREGMRDWDSVEIPYKDIQVTEGFVRDFEPLLTLLAARLFSEAMSVGPHLTDRDVTEALEAIIQTLRTAESGLVYEGRPDNQYAAEIHRSVSESVERIMEAVAVEGGALRNSDFLKMFVFLRQMAARCDNGRPKCRAFIHFLAGFTRPASPAEKVETPAESPGLIITP